MSSFEVCRQPAFILHQRPYRETGLWLSVFTRDYGIVNILAKGVRKTKSRSAGTLLPFAYLKISYLDKHELKILTQAELVESFDLQHLALYCGFYVNELLQRFLHVHDPHPEVFSIYQQCLQSLLDSSHIEHGLRYFELDLLNTIGYGILLDIDSLTDQPVVDNRRYRLIPHQGIIEDAKGLFSGRTLLTLCQRSELDQTTLSEAKVLLRQMMEPYLQGKPLKSRQVLTSILRHL